MAEGDDRRVEPRQVLIGRGMGVTPEKIADLQRRVEQAEKAARKEPVQPFSAVLARGRGATGDSDEELSEKDKRLQSLPKKGPRPGLVHPAQRDVYGREEEAQDTVVLKG